MTRREMDLEKLLARIGADAEKEAAAILEEARREAAETEARLREKARAEVAGRLEARKAGIDRERERALSAARLAAKKSVLAAKQAVLAEVYRAALAELTGNPEKQLVFFENALKRLPPGRYRLVASADLDKVLPEGWPAAGGNVPPGVEVEFGGYRDDLSGRLVLESGKVEFVICPERMLDLVRSEVEAGLVKLLFPGEEEETVMPAQTAGTKEDENRTSTPGSGRGKTGSGKRS